MTSPEKLTLTGGVAYLNDRKSYTIDAIVNDTFSLLPDEAFVAAGIPLIFTEITSLPFTPTNFAAASGNVVPGTGGATVGQLVNSH